MHYPTVNITDNSPKFGTGINWSKKILRMIKLVIVLNLVLSPLISSVIRPSAQPSVQLPSIASDQTSPPQNTSSESSHANTKTQAVLAQTVDLASLPSPQPGGAIRDNSLSRLLAGSSVGPLLVESTGRTVKAASLLSTSSRNTRPLVIAGTSSSSINVTSKFDALSEIGTCDCRPPDVQAATGPSHIVEMVNLGGAVYTKQGTLVKSFLLNGFFGTGLDFISDPKVLYDASSGRWFASLIDTTGSLTPSNLTIATSATSDPTGLWHVYKIVRVPGLTDQPLIGMSDDKFVISTNNFIISGFSAQFVGAQYWVLNKVELLSGQPTVDFISFGPDTTLISIHPAQSLSSTSTEWLVSNLPKGGETFVNNTINALSVNGVPPGPVTVGFTSLGVTIGTFANGSIPGGSQPGTTRTVNTNDIRMQDVSWFQGKLWFSMNDACKPTGDTQLRACIHLGLIDTGTLTLKQEFDVGLKGQYFFFPALRQDAFGNLAVIYGYSSSALAGGTDIYPSLAVVGQAVTDPINTVTPPQTLVTGTTSDISGRFGDYFAAAVDASNPSIVWVAGEYQNLAKGPRDGYNNWSTYIASVRMTKTDSPATQVTLSDFGISSSTPTMALGPGQQLTATITLWSVNFAGTLTLSATSGGASVSFNPSSITLPVGGIATSTLTATGTAPQMGFDSIAVSASGARLERTGITLLMTPLQYRFNNVTSFTGVSVTSTGTVSIDSPSNTFTISGSVSTVAKNSTTGAVLYTNTFPVSRLPFTLNASGYYRTQFLLNQWVNPYPLSSNFAVAYLGGFVGFGPGINDTTIGLTRNVDINQDGIVNPADVSIWQASAGATKGSPQYNPRADLNADGVVDFTDLNILNNYMGTVDLISSHALSSTRNTLSIPAGTTGATLLTATSINGFSGTVSLAATLSPIVANGPSASLNPTSLSITVGGSATSRLTVVSTGSTPPGIYAVNVTATTAQQTRSFGVAVVIKSPLDLSTTGSISGTSVTTTGSLTTDTGLSNNLLSVSGTLSVVATNSTTGALLWSYTYTLTRLTIPMYGPVTKGGTSAAFSFQRVLFFHIPVTKYPLALHILMIWPGPKSTSPQAPYFGFNEDIRNPDFDLNGVFDTNDGETLFVDSDCNIGNPCYDPRADLTASGGTGSASSNQHFTIFNVGSTDFLPYTVSANPSALTIIESSTASSIITLTSQGFSGTLGLTYTGTGPSATLSPTSVNLSAGGTITATLTVNGNIAAGNYTVTVIAVNAPQSASTTLTVRVIDFSLSTAQTTFVFGQGSKTSTITTVSSLNGFSGTVTLTSTMTPSAGPTVQFAPTSISLTPGGSGTSNTKLSASSTTQVGLYSIVITATSGSLSHTLTMVVVITPVSFQITDKEIFAGVNVTTTGTLTLDSPSNSLTVSGQMSTLAINSTTKAQISSKNYQLTSVPLETDNAAGFRLRFILNISATPTPLGSDIILKLPAPTSSTPGTPSWTVQVTRNPDLLQHGSVDFSEYSYVSARSGCKLGDPCYDPRADLFNDGVIDTDDLSLVSLFIYARNLNS